MLDDFILGWCGSVPLSFLIAWLLRHGPKPPRPFDILSTNLISGLGAAGAGAIGIGKSPGLGEIGSFIYPIAIGVLVAGLVGVVRFATAGEAKAQ